MIQLKDVSKFYHNKGMITSAISKVNLTLHKGEFVVITGESGSGKSTLLNVISGLDSYEEGEMYINGEETSHYMQEDFERYRKKYIGVVFQNYNLINSYTVYQNVELVLRIDGYRHRAMKQRVNEILDMVGLREFAGTKAAKLSGGQKQRAAIARAIARDTDIIVADEPTGNLDSKSAEDVARIFSEISDDKLVIVVTHNYQQFAKYATRLVRLHDGSIIENTVLRQPAGKESVPEQAVSPDSVPAVPGASGTIAYAPSGIAASPDTESSIESAAAKQTEGQPESMAKPAKPKKSKKSKPPTGRLSIISRIRLGWRNTFNIASKFILLLIVFLFMVAAVTSQYTSYLNQRAESEKIGYNSYFYNYDSSRIVLKKKDGSSFTKADYQALGNMSSIASIAKNDMLLDKSVYLENDDFSYEAFMHRLEEFDSSLSEGRMPEDDNEIVLMGSSDDYIFSNTNEILDQKFTIYVGTDTRLTLKVVGIAFDENAGEYETAGNIYLTDKMMGRINRETYADISTVSTTVNKQLLQYTKGSSFYRIMPNDLVDEGEAMVYEEVNNYYVKGKAKGHDITVEVDNIYYNNSLKLEITDTYKEKGFLEKTGYKSFDDYGGAIFVSHKDYNKLFSKANYQCSVYAANEDTEDQLIAALNRMGYTTLPLRDALVTSEDDITSFMQVPMIIIILLAVFFIGYLVIRLIFRSRTGYFTILRMLGMSKRHVRELIDIELLTVMTIASAIYAGVIYMVRSHIIRIEYVATLIRYMDPADYLILYIVMIILSLLLAGRFSRKLFKSTAMKTFREEA